VEGPHYRAPQAAFTDLLSGDSNKPALLQPTVPG